MKLLKQFNKKHPAFMKLHEVLEETISLLEYAEKVSGLDLKKLIKYLEHSDFFTAPASKKYHCSIHGGLAKHSLIVYHETAKILDSQLTTKNVENWKIILAALLHDLTKIDEYEYGKAWKKDSNNKWIEVNEYVEKKNKSKQFDLGHGSESAIILTRLVPEIPDDVLCAIMSHMGLYNEKEGAGFQRLNNSYRQTPLALALHSGDMFASYFVENILGNQFMEKLSQGYTDFTYKDNPRELIKGFYKLVGIDKKFGMAFTLNNVYVFLDGVLHDDNRKVLGKFDDLDFVKLFGLEFKRVED